MRIRLDTVGCRLNISEIERMGRTFVQDGHRLVGMGDMADLVIFNTCAVTNDASKVSRKIVRQLRASHPAARIVVTGCYADLEPAAMQALGADLVVDNRQKDALPELLAQMGWLSSAEPLSLMEDAPELPPTSTGELTGRTRAFIKVQDGCKNKCTFCIVTVARGESRSRALAELVAEIQTFANEGYQEAVLSGVHLGSYGQETTPPLDLRVLVETILRETDIPRLRLSSLEPWDIAPGFFELWQNPRLLPHLHLPLQSGADATLRRMARKTSQESFRQLVREAHAAIPNLAISTDVIVGFPGEDEREFSESFDFLQEIAFSRLHIFRYSRRAGTAAALMPKQVAPEIVKERSQKLHLLGSQLERQFCTAWIGKPMRVLWEHSEHFGLGKRWAGLNDQFVRVLLDTPAHEDLHNSVSEVIGQAYLPGAILSARSVNDGFAPNLFNSEPASRSIHLPML